MKGVLTRFVSLNRRTGRPQRAQDAAPSASGAGSGHPPTPAELWHAVPALDPRYHQHARTGHPPRRRSIGPLTTMILLALALTAASVAIDVVDALSGAGRQGVPGGETTSAWLQLYAKGWSGQRSAAAPPSPVPPRESGQPLQVPGLPPLAVLPEDRFTEDRAGGVSAALPPTTVVPPTAAQRQQTAPEDE